MVTTNRTRIKATGYSGTEAHDLLPARTREIGHKSQSPVRALAEQPERRRIMDTTKTTDCRFQSQCAAFKDRLISAKRKGPSQLGCSQQCDAHRVGHCKTFRCMSLAKKVAEAFIRSVDDGADEAYPDKQVARQTERAVCCAS